VPKKATCGRGTKNDAGSKAPNVYEHKEELHARPQPLLGRRRAERIGKYRAFYDVRQRERIVEVKVIGEKRGNMVVVRGEEYEL
jgi:hypothetical protein